jgi:putative membrane protein
MRHTTVRTAIVAGVLLVLATTAACGDDGNREVDPPVAAATVSATPTGPATGSATVTTPSPTGTATVTTTGTGTATVTAPATPAPEPTFAVQDRRYLIRAHQSNLAEIIAGEDAQRKATSAAVRAAGRRFVADHRALDTVVQRLAEAGNVTLPTTPSQSQRAALARVASQRGVAYDRAWLRQQMASHEASVALVNEEIANGEVPGVVASARNAKPVILGHMDLLDAAAADLEDSGVYGEDSGRPSGVSAGTGGQAAGGDVTVAALLAGLGVLTLGAGLVVARRRRQTTF